MRPRVSLGSNTCPDGRRPPVCAGCLPQSATLGAPLWDAGLSLANQGDVDAQTISGAIATGTKGSGLQFGSLSSTVRGVRLVNGQGEIVTITEDEPDLLHAAQVSSGRQSMRSDLPVAPPRRAPRDPAPCPGSIASRQTP